jgi:hypothetical protein
MKATRPLAICLGLLLFSALAHADSPITSPQIRTSIDNWLGSAFRGESYTPQQVDQIGQKLLGKIGQKKTSIGKVFDAVQTFHGAAFGINDSAQRKQAIKKFSRGLKKLWKVGDGGANAAAAYSINDVYTTLFTGNKAQVRNVEKTRGYRRLRSLQDSTRNPSIDVFVGMVKHYKDAFGHGSWDGTTKTSRQAVRTWSLAASKIIANGRRASTHSRNLLKKTLKYSQYYDGAYNAGAQRVSQIMSSKAPKQVKLRQLRQLRKGPLRIGRGR